MRILAIRGKNLASLSAGFVVDFQAEPLASAGLFAITGPTGAGKSTLLDALCLALYDATPRLDKATARNSEVPDVADASIAQHDPRTLLRRGAAEGFSEVDFVGNDGASYRSRWTVRRARNKADGKLQNSEISLESLADRQPLGDHRKTETLKLIESKIGLSFNQFTRAVLLAQNDFATFLKASDDERAELLQTLTGTHAFSDISKQAYVRMREERERLDRLQQQLASLAPLTAEVRGEKEVKYKQHTGQLASLEKAKGDTESCLRWHEQLTKQLALEADADKRLAEATAARVAAQARRDMLARVEQVQPARPLLAEQQRLSQEIATTQKAVGDCQQALALAAKGVDDGAAQLATAVQQTALADDSRNKARPLIDTARSLDARIAALTPPYEQAVQAHADAEQQQRQSTRQQQHEELALQRMETSLVAGERWLSERLGQQTLAEGWQGWDAIFAQALALDAEQGTLAKRSEALSQRDSAIASSLAQAQAGFAAQATEYQSAQDKLAALTVALKAFDSDAMAGRKQQLDGRREQLAQGDALWAESLTLQQRRRQLEEQRQAQSAMLATSAKVLDDLAQQKPLLEVARDAAARGYDLARLAASKSAEALRASLQADQPCPVCGALEHPYAEHLLPADAVLKVLQYDLEQGQKALTELAATVAARSAERNHAQSQLVQLEKDLAQSERAQAENRQRWSSLAIAAELSLIDDGERSRWFVEQHGVLKTALAQLNALEDGYRSAIRQKDDGQGELDRKQLALESARKSLSGLESEQQMARQALETVQQRRREVEQQLAATLAKLDGAFADSGWRAAWQADPYGFVASCRGDAEAWLRQQKQVAELSAQIATQKALVAAQSGVCGKAEADLKAATARLDEQASALRTLRAERQAVFDGNPIKDVEAALARVIGDAQALQATAQSELQKAQLERARQDEALRQASALLARNQRAHGEATRSFAAWLNDLNAQAGEGTLSPDALRELLAFDDSWISQERKVLLAADQAVDSANAVQTAQRAAREAHEKTRPSALGNDVLQDNLTKLQTEIAATGELCASLRAELLADDERLKNARVLLEAIDLQQKKTRLWSQLGELIGSADGKKFRNFAQQLTLDIMLGYGNRHLENLSRRYRLVRIKDSLGLLVIDQEMGDEVRSVHSLSGGESFLLSLALALGLASLSSHRVRVESLFIDEGFGSLDSESLRVAMDALDTLQAQGRKVGVISHVQEMTERIGVRIDVRRQPGGQSRVVVA